jgi:hypothetical protein
MGDPVQMMIQAAAKHPGFGFFVLARWDRQERQKTIQTPPIGNDLLVSVDFSSLLILDRIR